MERNYSRRNHSRSRSHSPNYDLDQNGEIPSKSTHLFSGNIGDSPFKFDQTFPNYTNSLYSEAPLSTKSPIFISSIPTTKCRFCQEQIPEDIIIEHQNVCEVKDAFCQACGESVPLDMFDYHLETCQPISHSTNLGIHDEQSPYLAQNIRNMLGNHGNEWGENEHNNDLYNLPLIHHDQQQEDRDASHSEEDLSHENPGLQSQDPYQFLQTQVANLFMQIQANIQQNHEGNANEEEGEDDEDDWEDEMDETDVQNYLAMHDPSTMTYEQLMVLDEGIVKKGLTETELEKFPLEMYLKDCDGENSCTICITEYESGEVIRKLTCSHKFHKECVDTWLTNNITCPICKKYFR